MSAVRRLAPMQPTGSKPDPDPTVLTTQGLIRESDHIRELTDAIAEGMKQTFETRLNGMDKAIVLVRESNQQVPELISAAITHLREVHQVKFESIRDQFSERDTRTDQTRADAKLALDVALQGAAKAVDAAFSAAKEAALKIEASFTKQIDQLRDLTGAQQKNTDDKIDDLKTRLTAMVSEKSGSNNIVVFAISIAGLVIAFIAATAAAASFLKH
jgi:hypothetical protein